MLEDDSIDGAGAAETFEARPIGAYLRRQRVLRGMTAVELAELTRIPLRSLERLEGGLFDGETDGFVRGFVRTVASALGLDADDTVARMLQEPSANAWQRHGPGRSAKQVLAVVLFVVAMGCVVLGLSAPLCARTGRSFSQRNAISCTRFCLRRLRLNGYYSVVLARVASMKVSMKSIFTPGQTSTAIRRSYRRSTPIPLCCKRASVPW